LLEMESAGMEVLDGVKIDVLDYTYEDGVTT